MRAISLVSLAIIVAGVAINVLTYKLPPPINTDESTTITQLEAAVSTSQHAPKISDSQNLKWENVGLPHNWGKTWPHHNGVVWYRINLPRTSSQLEDQSILAPYVGQAATLFVNGIEIATTSPTWPPKSSSWYTPQLWAIPSGLLQSGPNQILIAVYGYASARPGLPRITIGQEHDLYKTYQNLYLVQQSASFVCVIFGAILSLLCGMFWLLQRQNSAALWQSMLCLSLTITHCESQQILADFINQHIGITGGFTLQTLSGLFIGPTFFLTVLRYYDKHFKNIERILLCTVVLCIAAILFAPFDLFIISKTVSLILVMLLLIVASFLGQYWGWTKDSKLTDKIFAITCMPLGPVGLFDVAANLDWIPTHALAEIVGASITDVVVIFLYSWRFFQVSINSKEQSDLLDKRVAKVSLELEQALIRKHEHEINQIKHVERNQFWRDLHDGFSSTLLGTITLLETKSLTPVETTQLLQNTREELRMSIRVGTTQLQSLHTILEIVRTSMLDQLQAEKIHLIWGSPSDLPVTGNVAQQLPLIVREALVNVIKHSHATQVICNFQVVDNDLLHVFIQDNGKHPEGEAESKSISKGVGLQSMQIRVKSLGGNLLWKKETTGTTIAFTVQLHPAKKAAQVPVGLMHV